MTPERVLAALAKNPRLFYDVLWNAQVLGAWVRRTRNHKVGAKKSSTTTWTREMHPRLKGSSPVVIEQDGDPYDEGLTYTVRIDTDGDGDKGHQRTFTELKDAQAHADQVLQNTGWVLVDDDDGETEDGDLQDTLRRILVLLGEGKQSFIDWQRDVKLIDVQALQRKWTKQQVLNRKQRSWQDYIRKNAMPRNHTIRGLLTEVTSSPFPDPVAEFFQYCDEYDDLFVTWDNGAKGPLATGRNFPADLDGFILGMLNAP